jgi:hypothetical protein
MVDDLLLDDRNVHDREDARLPEVFDLGFFVAGKQTRDSLVAINDRLRNIGIDHCRNLALRQHRIHRFARWNHLDLQARWWRERDIFAAIDHPGDLLMRHAISLFQDSAQPDIARWLEVGSTHSFADEIFRRLDARIDVDEGKAVTKSPMQKNWNRRKRFVVVPRHQIRTDVKFADVELLVARHAPVALSRPMAGQYHKLEAVRLHRPVLQRANNFVIAAGNRQSNL